jgi:hypothetical protein
MERKLMGVRVRLGCRHTNLLFPDERSSVRFWKKHSVDITWEEGFSDAMITDWLNGIMHWADSVGIAPDQQVVVRFAWDATDINKRLSHDKEYKFQGDHNASAPFVRDNLTFQDPLPDPSVLEALFQEVMGHVDACKQQRRRGSPSIGEDTPAEERLTHLQKVRSYLEDPQRTELLKAALHQLQQKVKGKALEYEVKNKKRNNDAPQELSPQQRSAIWHIKNKADKLSSILQSAIDFAKSVADLPESVVGKEETIAQLTLSARNIIIKFTDCCRHACSKFYSFRLQCTNAVDSSAVCRMRVERLPEGAFIQICEKVAEKVKELSKGKVVVKMLSADLGASDRGSIGVEM